MSPVEALKFWDGIPTAPYIKDPLAVHNLEVVSAEQVIDYLEALEFAFKQGWWHFKTFDTRKYIHYDDFSNGDINWIVPGVVLAFSGPSDNPQEATYALGGPSNTCELVLAKLSECGVKTIIRLNEEEYDRNFFLQRGIDHVDVIFEDGTVPNEVAAASRG